MITLLRILGIRHLRRHRLRAVLGLLAIALGVALFVACRATTLSVERAVAQAAEDLAGKAQWQVTRGRSLGVELRLVEKIRAIPGAIAAPLIQTSTTLLDPRGGSMLILGVDFRSDALLRLYKFRGAVDPASLLATALVPDAIMITRSMADRHGLAVGSQVQIDTHSGPRSMRVTATLEDEGPARVFGGNFGIIELHSAQKLFGRAGFVDRIEVAGVTLEQLRAVCPEYDVAPATRSSTVVEDALERLRGVTVVALVALLVAVFLIYNSVQISITERSKDIATLRALGATRRQVIQAILLESLALGAVGSILGIAIGWGLAWTLARFTTQTLNAMVMVVDLRHVALGAGTVVGAMALGLGATLSAAWLGAREILRITPIDALRVQTYRAAQRHRRALWIGATLVLIGIIMVPMGQVWPIVALVAAAFVFLGLPLMLPELMLRIGNRLRPFCRKSLKLSWYLALDNLLKFPQRTALTTVALGGALAMMLATATLVLGISRGTAEWMRDAFAFDLVVSATDLNESLYGQRSLPRELVAAVRDVDGVDLAYGVRSLFADYRDKDIMVVAVEIDPFLEMHRRRGSTGFSRQIAEGGALARGKSGDAVYVSHNFAQLYSVSPGDRIELPTPSGVRTVEVIDAVEDYSWPRGTVLMDLDVLQRLWGDTTISYIDVSVRPTATIEDVRLRISELLRGKHNAFVFDISQMRQISEQVLDQMVALANMQVLVAIVIGVLGVVNTLLISVLQRTREIGLVRAIGMTRGQAARIVVIEAIFVSIIAGIVGMVGGVLAGWFPLRAFTLAVTGFRVPIVIPVWHAIAALVVAVMVGFLASLIPARRAARLNVLQAIAHE